MRDATEIGSHRETSTMKTNRRIKFGWLFCVALSPLVAFSQNNPGSNGDATKSHSIQKTILRLEEAGRQKALRGDNSWDDLIAENAYMIAFDGTIIVYRRGQNLPAIPLRSFVLSEMIVRVYHDEAVVTGLATVEAETPDKKPYAFQMRFLNVWKRFHHEWRIVVSERTGVKTPSR